MPLTQRLLNKYKIVMSPTTLLKNNNVGIFEELVP